MKEKLVELAFSAILFLFKGLMVMLLWNWFVFDIPNFPVISYNDALKLCLLVSVLMVNMERK